MNQFGETQPLDLISASIEQVFSYQRNSQFLSFHPIPRYAFFTKFSPDTKFFKFVRVSAGGSNYDPIW